MSIDVGSDPQIVVGESNNLNQTSHTVEPPQRLTAEPTVFSQEDVTRAVEQARAQEKSKVYGRLETLQEQVARLTREADERAALEAAAIAEKDEAARKAAEAEMDVRTLLEQKEREWNERLQNIELERQREREIHELQQQEIALRQYRDNAIKANEESILPELLDLVASGPTQSEIDASIAGLIQRSSSILEAAAEQVNLARRDQRTVSPTGGPTSGPLDNTPGQKTLTAADIAAMPMDEYAKYRASLGVSGNTNRGLFS